MVPAIFEEKSVLAITQSEDLLVTAVQAQDEAVIRRHIIRASANGKHNHCGSGPIRIRSEAGQK